MPSDPPPLSTTPRNVDPQREDAITPVDPPARDTPASERERRAFRAGDAPDLGEAPRPQADFGAPIDIGSVHPDAAPPVTRPTAEVPPLIAAADDTATPQLAEQRPAPALTQQISQGMPSYAEPGARAAGVIGRAASGNDRAPE